MNFFCICIGGRIDHAHHDTNAYRANHDVYALHKAVEEAKSLTNEEDTLIVVTADHSHAFSIAGYPHINKDLYGKLGTDSTLWLKMKFISSCTAELSNFRSLQDLSMTPKHQGLT